MGSFPMVSHTRAQRHAGVVALCFPLAWRCAPFLALLLATATVARADEQDPPGRVARVSLTQGSVSLQPAGTQEWSNADRNRPLTTGDKLWSDANSRAELDIGSAAVRLGSTTGFSFLNLDDRVIQMRITAGTLIVRVRALRDGESFEVDTPNLALSLLQPGQYRVEVNDAGDRTIVKVSEGDAQAHASQQGFAIHAQQRATFAGTGQLVSTLGTLGSPDDLDSWSLARDRHIRNAQSQRYVSTEATGYADLDDNGRWESTPDYGYVWTPTTVAVGWAPYRYGHWVWITPWGWTWIDDAPWGFAPFHYGRWVTYRDSWCWVPGPRYVRPVYAPALVAWVGGPAVGVSVVIGGGVGWFPLGPREVYVPAYRVSPRYVENVNITNTWIENRTYITNVYENRLNNLTYVNRNVPGGVTSVSQSVFTTAQPVGRNLMRLPEGQLRTFTPRAAAPDIAPERESLMGAQSRANVRRPPQDFMDRQVVVRSTPPRAPAPFERQSEAIRANGGRPLGREELSRLQSEGAAPAVRLAAPLRNDALGQEEGRRFDGDRAPNRLQTAPDASLADRERALRDHRIEGPQLDRPPVPSRQGFRVDRPPVATQAEVESNRPTQNTFTPQDRSVPQERGLGTFREDDSVQRFDRPRAQRPQNNFEPPPEERPQVERAPVERPQIRELQSRPPFSAPPPVEAPRIERLQPQPMPQQQAMPARPSAAPLPAERSERPQERPGRSASPGERDR